MGDRVDYLFEPEGAELHWDGLKEKQAPQPQQASLSGPAPTYSSAPQEQHPSARKGMYGSSADQAGGYRQMTPDQLEAAARQMMAQTEANSSMLAAGPAAGDRDDAGNKLPDWLKSAAGR
jgi:hypothetical protein